MKRTSDIISVTPTLDTNAYAAGDTLFDVTPIPRGVSFTGGSGVLQSLTIIDKDDQTAAAMNVFLFSTGSEGLVFGVANAAPSISDANTAALLGVVPIASGDWIDNGGSKMACIKNIGLVLESANGRELGFAATTAGSPTQTAAGLVFKFGITQ